MGVEAICLREARHLAKRIKFWSLIGKLYLASLVKPREAKIARASYFFCRHIDDVLDGDRKIVGDPAKYVNDILGSIENGSEDSEIVELYRYAIGELEEMARYGDNPKSCFVRVIKDAMLFDYKRARDTRVLTRDELENYYSDTFAPVMDIALMISGSGQRSVNIPEMVATQGHLYSIRDMEKDLERGLVNIPREEVERAGLDADLSYNAVMKSQELTSWIGSEIDKYQEELRVAKGRLLDSGSRRIFLPLIREMEEFCRSYAP